MCVCVSMRGGGAEGGVSMYVFECVCVCVRVQK